MDIVFKNNGVISLIDMMSMGDSIKREKEGCIGKFDSGLKYALCILYRNGITVEIISNNVKYEFDTEVTHDKLTKKSKELLVIKQTVNGETLEHLTAFSPNLGFEWKVWMAIRELYANCLDENGEVCFNENTNDSEVDSTLRTIIRVKDNSLLAEIIINWDNYFLDKDLAPLLKTEHPYNVSIFENKSGHLKLYKNRILVFEDESVKSIYCYDYKGASIDEMRLLNDLGSFKESIAYAIQNTSDRAFIQDYLSHSGLDFFESNFNYFYTFTKEWIEIVNEIYSVNVKHILLPSLYRRLIELPEVEIGVKSVKYNSQSHGFLRTEVELVSPAKEINDVLTFENKIKKISKNFNFEIKHPIIESKIKGYTCVADTNKKVLYVTQEFSENTFWEMIKAHFRIDGDDDSDYVFKEYVNQLKK